MRFSVFSSITTHTLHSKHTLQNIVLSLLHPSSSSSCCCHLNLASPFIVVYHTEIKTRAFVWINERRSDENHFESNICEEGFLNNDSFFGVTYWSALVGLLHVVFLSFGKSWIELLFCSFQNLGPFILASYSHSMSLLVMEICPFLLSWTNRNKQTTTKKT